MEDFYNGLEGPEKLNLNRKTTDVKLIVGILIILMSILLGIVSNIISSGGIYRLKDDMAYFIGTLLGTVFINVIISAAILVISKKNRGRNLLIFSIIAVVLSFSNFSFSLNEVIAERQKEKVATDKIISMVKDLASQKEIIKEDISEAKYGKSASLVEIFQNNYLEFQNLRKENEIIAGIMNDPSTFSKETLSDLNKVKEKIELLDKTSKDIEVLGNKMNDLLKSFKSSIENDDISIGMKEDFKTRIGESFSESTETAANSLKHMGNVIKSMKSMLAFLVENEGAYTFEGEQLAFYKDQDVNAYNKLFEEYNKTIDENNKNYEDVQKRVKEKIMEMEKVAE